MVGYSKLEVKGEWKSNSDQSTEVLVAFGSISLNILNTEGEPLRQWAYSSIFLKSKGPSKSMFCPDVEETESLYIFDRDAVNHLICLCNKNTRKKFLNFFPWLFIIFLLIVSSSLFSGYFRIGREKIALSITSAEQEVNIGNIMLSEFSGVSYCDINNTIQYSSSSPIISSILISLGIISMIVYIIGSMHIVVMKAIKQSLFLLLTTNLPQ